MCRACCTVGSIPAGRSMCRCVFFFQAEDGIRDYKVTGVRRVLFRSDAIPAARAPKMGTIVHRAVRHLESGQGAGALEVTAEWVDYQGHALLREDTRFVFRAGDGLRAVDRITTLTALGQTVTFADEKDGLLGLRVARSLEQPSATAEVFTDAAGHATSVPVLNNAGVTGRYSSSEGLEGDSVWGTRGRWTMLSGI